MASSKSTDPRAARSSVTSVVLPSSMWIRWRSSGQRVAHGTDAGRELAIEDDGLEVGVVERYFSSSST